MLEFIELVGEGELPAAIEFASVELARYTREFKDHHFKIPTKNAQGRNVEIDLPEVTALLCYSDPESSDLRHLVSENQRHMLADKINNEILSKNSKLIDRVR